MAKNELDLQMEDYALLMGTALLLVMLAALMVVSRNLARGNK
jgi:inner membrane protein